MPSACAPRNRSLQMPTSRFQAISFLAVFAACLVASARPDLRRDPTPIPGQPFHRYTTHDKLGREITCYLSEAAAEGPPRPLVVFIHGSGGQSLFMEKD